MPGKDRKQDRYLNLKTTELETESRTKTAIFRSRKRNPERARAYDRDHDIRELQQTSLIKLLSLHHECVVKRVNGAERQTRRCVSLDMPQGPLRRRTTSSSYRH